MARYQTKWCSSFFFFPLAWLLTIWCRSDFYDVSSLRWVTTGALHQHVTFHYHKVSRKCTKSVCALKNKYHLVWYLRFIHLEMLFGITLHFLRADFVLSKYFGAIKGKVCSDWCQCCWFFPACSTGDQRNVNGLSQLLEIVPRHDFTLTTGLVYDTTEMS